MRNLHQLTLPRAASGWLWAGILVLLLGACGTLEALPPGTEPVSAGTDHAYIASVDITDTDTAEAIAATYGGDVIVWRPEAGFAILGLPEHTGELSTLRTKTRNVDVVSVPMFGTDPGGATDSGAHAWAGSVNAWAGGVSAWAGGVSAWAGGVNAWAGGVDNPFPGNEGYWEQMQLGQAQDATTYRGQGVTIAIIDTGLDLDHAGFTGRLAPSSAWLDLVDGDAYPHEGYVVSCTLRRGNTCRETSLVKTGDGPFFGHGTAVAGVALQAAPGATILPIRVLSSWGSGSATNVAIAIDHAIERGADVINLSLGTFEPVPAIDQMLAYAGQRGVVVVTASGNTGNDMVWYPARTATGADFPHAISVGSVTATDRKSWFSTYGLLEVVAPGEGIGTLYPGDAMAYAIGTSFAAPWVAGTVALILADQVSADGNTAPDPVIHLPTEIVTHATSQPTHPGVEALLTASDDIDHLNPNWAGRLGNGRLNALDAVLDALGR